MTLSGSPKIVLDVSDKSIIQSQPLAGIAIVQGPTLRGKIGEPLFIGNSLQFTRKLGGDFSASESKFPIYCKRILDAGGKLWVIRAGHYTTITDKTTLAGTKAAATITVSSNNSIWNAEEVGAGYNGTTIVIIDASSGTAGYKDITITLKDSDVSTIIRDVKAIMSAGEISDFNNLLKGKGAGVTLVSIATQIENGTGTLAAGAQTVSAIVAADYTGSTAGQNGWYVADKVVDAMRIANIGLPGDEDVDEGLRGYCVARGDMRFYIGTPLGLTPTGMQAYREGTSPYSNAPADTWYGSLIAGDINITDATNRDKTFDIPGVVDRLSGRLRADVRFGPWYSDAGIKYGQVISPNNGVPLNLASPALSADFDNLVNRGINAMVQDPDYGVCYWGNDTLLKNPNSILRAENCADTVIHIIRGLKPLVRVMLFSPHDPVSWKETYRRVLPFINQLETSRAIRPGENKMWFWQGDQDADRAEDAKFNTQDDINAGRYKVRFVFVPVTSIKFIGIEITPTDSNSVKFVVTENVVI